MKEKIIEILKNNIESCNELKGLEREKAVYQSILKTVRKLHSEPTTEEKPTDLWDKVEKINAEKREQTDNENTEESKGVEYVCDNCKLHPCSDIQIQKGMKYTDCKFHEKIIESITKDKTE